MPLEWRDDYNELLDPGDDRPSRTELEDPHPINPPLTGPERAEADARITTLWNPHRRNAYPITRCDTWSCHTTVDLGEDPAALCDTCGLVTCTGCTHICTGSAA